MSRLERKLITGGVILAILALGMWTFSGGTRLFPTPTAHACPSIAGVPSPNCYNLAYYGANLSGMQVATGVSTSNNYPNGPWPQYAGNYCFLASIQAVANYANWDQGWTIPYPNASDEGPASSDGNPADNGNPNNEQPGQILYDLDNVVDNSQPQFSLVANFPPGPDIVNDGGSAPWFRRGFTLADTSHDGGGDPRAVAAGTWYETPNDHYYHQYIYHYNQSNVSWAVAGFAYAVDAYDEPVTVVVNGGLHMVVVAGVWSYGDPIQTFPAAVESVAVYNPWNQGWGSYLNGAYYSRVSYADWTGTDPLNYGGFWWAHGYDWSNSQGKYVNTTYDPDPYMGIYQAGVDPITGRATANPNAQHWVGWFVDIERDDNVSGGYNPNIAYNENDQPMGGP